MIEILLMIDTILLTMLVVMKARPKAGKEIVPLRPKRMKMKVQVSKEERELLDKIEKYDGGM